MKTITEFIYKWQLPAHEGIAKEMANDLIDLIHNERMDAIEEYKQKQIGHDEENE